jgi:hypothetical protein
MPNKVWECTKCGHAHKSENEAIKCEEAHTPTSKLEILAAGFSSNHGWGPTRALQLICPSWIRVKFGDEHGQFAVYKRESVGYKGV